MKKMVNICLYTGLGHKLGVSHLAFNTALYLAKEQHKRILLLTLLSDLSVYLYDYQDGNYTIKGESKHSYQLDWQVFPDKKELIYAVETKKFDQYDEVIVCNEFSFGSSEDLTKEYLTWGKVVNQEIICVSQESRVLDRLITILKVKEQIPIKTQIILNSYNPKAYLNLKRIKKWFETLAADYHESYLKDWHLTAVIEFYQQIVLDAEFSSVPLLLLPKTHQSKVFLKKYRKLISVLLTE